MALTDNLVAYYKLDESSGNAADASGAGLTLTNTNTVVFSAGKINNGGAFTRTSSQYFTSSNAAFSLTGSLSMSFWIKASAAQVTGVNCGMVSNATSGGNGYLLRIENDGFVYFRLASGPTGQTSTQAAGAGNIVNFNVADSVFHHVVGTYDGTTAKIYVDDTLCASRAITATLTSPGNFNVGLDNTTTASYMNGNLDEVGLWSRALSATEVTTLYNGGAGLQYPFITTDTISVSDSSATTDTPTIETILQGVTPSDSSAVSDTPTIAQADTILIAQPIRQGVKII